MNLSTSLICTDLCNVTKDLDILVDNGITWFHADFMDGHFVPRYGISPELIQSLRKRYGENITIDSHLMVSDPYTYAHVIAPYSNWYIFHYEAVTDPMRTLQMLRKTYPTLKIGLAFNLGTPSLIVENVINSLTDVYIDGVMFMGISPGVLGTISMPNNVINKLECINKLNKETGFDIKTFIDGSVNFKTLPEYKKLNCYTAVCGSSTIFKIDENTSNLSREDMINYNINRISEVI